MRWHSVFLLSIALGCSARTPGTPEPAPPSPVALPSPQEVALRTQTADQQIRQALDRLTFGARSGDYETVRKIGVDRWIAGQLHPARIDDRAADAFLSHFTTLASTPAELVREYPPPRVAKAQAQRQVNGRAAQQLIADVQSAKVARAVMSDRQLQEVMTDF